MKSHIATDPSQSQRLIACGVDPKTADMCWSDHFHFNLTDKILQLKKVQYTDEIPAYSLSRMLSLLPKEIESDDYNYIWLEIIWIHEDKNVSTIRYYTPPNEHTDDYDFWEFSDENIIEAIVQAIEWLTKDGYKLNTIEE